ncbi:MAG: MFS transporter [Patescibacteria group bacterium]
MQHFFDLRKTHFTLWKRGEYIPTRISPHLKELYAVMGMLNFVFSALMLYEPIYLYTIGFTLWQIMLFYAGVYAAYLVLMPIGGMIAKQKGFEHSIMYSSAFLIFYLIFLLNIPLYPLFTLLAILALAIQKTLFWPGYHADFAFFSQSEERGRQISINALMESIMAVLGPLIGGLIAASFGFTTLFIIICGIVLASNIPFFLIKEQFTPTKMDYGESYRYLLQKNNRPYFWGYVGFGEELIVLTVWPIFFYIVFGTILSTGLAIAFSTLVTIVIVLYIGRSTDSKDRKHILRIGALCISASWFLRLLVSGAPSVMLLDFFSRISKNIFAIPMVANLYEYASHTSYIKNMIFFEMSLSVGKLGTALFLAAAFYIFGPVWQVAFVLGGFLSLLFFLLGKKWHNGHHFDH